MKRFLILILFSLFFPIQNSSAVSPSLEETMDFLIGSALNKGAWTNKEWSVNDCILEYGIDSTSGVWVDLNLVDLNSFKPTSKGFKVDCIGDCRSSKYFGNWGPENFWEVENGKSWTRNKKALDHLYSNFCTGIKSAF